MQKPKILFLTGVVGLALAAVAYAAAPLAYTTPKAIAAKIHGPTPQIETGNAHVPSDISATVCTGLGAAHKGTFNTFRCKATYLNGQKKANVWVRALPGGKFCASSTGLNACPAAAATVGDPRICSNAPAPSTADPNSCAGGAAIGALTRAGQVQFTNPNFQVRNLSCTGNNLGWACVFSTSADYTVYHSKIAFVQSVQGVWAATVTLAAPTITGGSATCQVVSGPLVSGARSRWTAGPAATCATP